MSALSHYLQQQQFCLVLEQIVSKRTELPPISTLAGLPCVMAFADRVHADDDPSPISLANSVSPEQAKLLHFSGKARDVKDLQQFVEQAKQQNLHDVLLLTGDKLKQHNFGHTDPRQRTRYLESVSALMWVKAHAPDTYCSVAFNPFKYTESEEQAQYLKFEKKQRAGADFVITQLGYDLNKILKFKQFVNASTQLCPVLACVMPLTYRRAKFMVKQQVAGIEISRHLLQHLKAELQENAAWAEQRVYARAALQIWIYRHWGLAGIHVSGCQNPEQQALLEQALAQYETWTLEQCLAEWNHLCKIVRGDEMQPDLSAAYPQRQASVLKYQILQVTHDWLFDSTLAQKIGRFVFQRQFWQQGLAAKSILAVEHASKHAVVGCESCGQCRLAETLYICPETCPKGLANGPCGGTRLDRCEFADRECIHSQKYRLAKQVRQQDILRYELIPAVPVEIRQTSSWVNWFNPKSH
ncbi:methylenetetrahydrofolate reductase C-terminal domain-containing protein [Acinetobacter brisouii]|uniref:methylenetetrahydrofolate reductase C-terminal domain-containing protein n=1 Tax=Acinetobacter brisouii TaxID=396323 RepID=UPI0035B1AC59